MITVNVHATHNLVRRLKACHRSAFPLAIRGTLNRAAFDMKGGPGSRATLVGVAERTFKKRHTGNVYKALSKVERAQGFNVDGMRAVAGFVSSAKSRDMAEDLEKQEVGGSIGGRSFLPMDPARRGGKNVKEENLISKIRKKKIINVSGLSGVSQKQRFVRAAFMAKKLNPDDAYVLGSKRKGHRTLSRINRIERGKSGKKIRYSRTALFSVKGDFIARVHGTGFRKRAAHETTLRMEDFWIQEAERQIMKPMLKK